MCAAARTQPTPCPTARRLARRCADTIARFKFDESKPIPTAMTTEWSVVCCRNPRALILNKAFEDADMRRYQGRARAALTIAMLAIAGGTVTAQTQSNGWPSAAEQK